MLRPETIERENYRLEKYRNPVIKMMVVELDYRMHDGRLFSCIAKTENAAWKKFDAWKERNEYI